jgi:hypothetical protein
MRNHHPSGRERRLSLVAAALGTRNGHKSGMDSDEPFELGLVYDGSKAIEFKSEREAGRSLGE